MKPSLHHLVEDYFRPKWWQFCKQKYHACQNYGSFVIYEVPDKCMISGKLHNATVAARLIGNEIIPNCNDGCSPIKASDPTFFRKLDEYLERGCYAEESLKAEKFVSATMAGPMGPPGPPASSGPGWA